jgi:hypothetical protein
MKTFRSGDGAKEKEREKIFLYQVKEEEVIHEEEEKEASIS